MTVRVAYWRETPWLAPAWRGRRPAPRRRQAVQRRCARSRWGVSRHRVGVRLPLAGGGTGRVGWGGHGSVRLAGGEPRQRRDLADGEACLGGRSGGSSPGPRHRRGRGLPTPSHAAPQCQSSARHRPAPPGGLPPLPLPIRPAPRRGTPATQSLCKTLPVTRLFVIACLGNAYLLVSLASGGS